MKLMALLILTIFYSIYISKMIIQKKQGIKTDQMAKGKAKGILFYTELLMKIATYSVVFVETISILYLNPVEPFVLSLFGMGLGIAGVIVFAIAIITMKNSWRAGISKSDKTKIVTDGIYQFSRNPAFLGFDLMYLGILLMFFNWVLLLFSIFAMIMLHLQILQEEKFLPQIFGSAYLEYKSKVCRYLGRKH